MNLHEEQPNATDGTAQPKPPFWLMYLRIMGIDSLAVFILAFLLGGLEGGLEQVSNLYFWSSVILLGVAVVPVFSEVGGNFRTIHRLSKGEKMADLIRAQEESAKSGWRITSLYGLCGMSAFGLSIITSLWWQI